MEDEQQRFGRTNCLSSQQKTEAGSSIFMTEDAGNIFFRNVEIHPTNYSIITQWTILQEDSTPSLVSQQAGVAVTLYTCI
jgi:hypothetical protein